MIYSVLFVYVTTFFVFYVVDCPTYLASYFDFRILVPSLFYLYVLLYIFFFFQAEDGIRDGTVTGVQTCALPISNANGPGSSGFGGSVRPRSSSVLGASVIWGLVSGGAHAASATWPPGRRTRRVDRKSVV